MAIASRLGSSASSLWFFSAVFLATAAAAQVPTTPVPRVLMGDLACIPRDGHALAQAVAGPLGPNDDVRFYFRREGYGDFYWVPARPTSDGRFWGVLPVPEPDNQRAEIYAAVVTESGMPIAQSRVAHVPVEPNCRVLLRNSQSEDANHLTVGETSLGQKFRKVAWWQCEGIRQRVDVRGERRDDEACLPIAWWEQPELLAPLVLVGGGTVAVVGVTPTSQPPEVSPSNP
jgi:hypothetical protein